MLPSPRVLWPLQAQDPPGEGCAGEPRTVTLGSQCPALARKTAFLSCKAQAMKDLPLKVLPPDYEGHWLGVGGEAGRTPFFLSHLKPWFCFLNKFLVMKHN